MLKKGVGNCNCFDHKPLCYRKLLYVIIAWYMIISRCMCIRCKRQRLLTLALAGPWATWAHHACGVLKHAMQHSKRQRRCLLNLMYHIASGNAAIESLFHAATPLSKGVWLELCTLHASFATPFPGFGDIELCTRAATASCTIAVARSRRTQHRRFARSP